MVTSFLQNSIWYHFGTGFQKVKTSLILLASYNRAALQIGQKDQQGGLLEVVTKPSLYLRIVFLSLLVSGARDFQELLMSLDQKEPIKCNQKRVNVCFRFLKVRLYFLKRILFERLQLLRIPCDGRVWSAGAMGSESSVFGKSYFLWWHENVPLSQTLPYITSIWWIISSYHFHIYLSNMGKIQRRLFHLHCSDQQITPKM